MEEIPILGVVIGRGQVQMEANKVKAIKKWKIPTKIKEVKSFLRFTNFYKWFIKNFSHMEKLLNELKGKKEWKWEEKQQNAFKELKEKSTSSRSSKKRRKIPSKNQHIRTCHRRSLITRTRQKMEIYHIFIKNNTTGGTKLQDL